MKSNDNNGKRIEWTGAGGQHFLAVVIDEAQEVIDECWGTKNDLAAFDAAFFGHISFTLSNAGRALWLGFTGGWGYPVPGTPETRRYLQQMARCSSAFAFAAASALMRSSCSRCFRSASS